MNTRADEIISKTESLSKEMIAFIEALAKKNPNKQISYSEYITTYFLLKIAELEEEIKDLKNKFTHININ
jgi:hypothetical protein